MGTYAACDAPRHTDRRCAVAVGREKRGSVERESGRRAHEDGPFAVNYERWPCTAAAAAAAACTSANDGPVSSSRSVLNRCRDRWIAAGRDGHRRQSDQCYSVGPNDGVWRSTDSGPDHCLQVLRSLTTTTYACEDYPCRLDEHDSMMHR